MLQNRILYIVMILLSIITLAISGSHGSFVMLMTLIILPIVSFAFLLVVRRNLRCSQELSSSFIMKGESATYTATIWCEYSHLAFAFAGVAFSPLPKSLVISNERSTLDSPLLKKTAAAFELFGKNRTIFSREIKGCYRTVCAVGTDCIELYDFLRIFKIRKTMTNNPMLIVCPDIVPFSDELFASAPSQESGISRRASVEDYSAVTDTRKYEYSDSMKRIHWKLSAKKNELLIKNYDHTNTMVAAIIIDNRKTSDDIISPEALEDKLIETAVSISKFNLDGNYPVILDFMELSSPARAYESGSAGFDRLFLAASSIRMDEEDIEPLFSEYYNPNFLISALYLMTSNPDGKVQTFLENMAGTGLDTNLVHFYEKDTAAKVKVYEGNSVNYYGVKVGK